MPADWLAGTTILSPAVFSLIVLTASPLPFVTVRATLAFAGSLVRVRTVLTPSGARVRKSKPLSSSPGANALTVLVLEVILVIRA